MKRKIQIVTITLFSLVSLFSCASPSEKQLEPKGQIEALENAIEALEIETGLEDPEDIMAWVNVPRIAEVGDTILLEIFVENGREKKEFKLSGFDILDEFLEGFHILDINPEPRHKDHSLGSLGLAYPIVLKPGETFQIELKLKAERAGIFIGDVDVMEGDEFLTRHAQIRVN